VTYDSRGRLAVLTQGIGASARTTTLAYNADGFLSSFTDAASRTMSFGYDAAGRVTSRTLADGNTVSLAYDSAGNLTNLTPPGKLAHTLGYSDRNELISVTPPALPGSGSTIYAYDVDRKATTLTRPDGRTITLGYDSAGRIVTRSLAAGGVTVGTDTFGYDATGHLSAMAAANGVTLGYSYDGALMTGRTWSGPVAGSVTRSYDNSFRVAAESVNGGATIAYSYDADDLLIGAGALTIARDAQSGFPTSTSLGITTTAFGYNGFGEQTSYTAAAGGSQLFAQTFTRDALGRVASKSETVGGLTDTYAYSYDLAGQLTTVAKNGVTSESYVYDGNGDRISASVGANSVSGTYDDQDRLTAYGSTSFAYSAAGDLVSKTTGAAITTYQHDALGNLLSVTLPNGTTVSYLSDSNGRRVGKKINGSLVKGFIYSDRRRIAAELDGSGAVVTRFAYAGDDTPVAMIKGGVTFRVISDQNGSVRLIVDSATGAIAQRIDYDSFGNVILDTNRGFQPLGFAGGLYDPDTGLTRYGVRDYDPSIGRWTAKDPSWFAGNDGNLYRYASNDPVNLVDRTGKAATPPKTPNPFEELENIITKIERAHNPETGEPLEPFAEFSKRRKGIVELRKVGEWKKLQAQCLKEIDSIIDKFLKKLHGIGELPGIIDVVVEAIKADREGRDFTLKDAAETYLGYPLLDDLLGVPNSRLEI
jgi:RHS repeat-associated protein